MPSNSPDTLPADFFSGGNQPDTLPANFSFPKGNQPANLPNVTNEDLGRFGKRAVGALPWIGAGIGTAVAPELAGAGWLVNTAIGAGAAALGGGAGAVAEQGIKSLAGTKDRAQDVGEFASRVGKEAAAQGLGELGGRVLAKPFSFVLKKFAPQNLYGSALKPSTALEPAERSRIINAGLSEGIPVSDTGYTQLVTAVKDTNNAINNAMAQKSANLGAVISPKNVTDRLDALATHYEKQAYPEDDIATIRKIRDAYAKRHSSEAPFTKIQPGVDEVAGSYVPAGKGTTQIPEPLTLAEAQAEKRGTYRFNQGAYGQLSGAQAEAEKNMARTLREQIVALFPEIDKMNARDKSLIELEEQLKKFVGREGNKNMIGLIPAVAGAGTGLFGGIMSGDTKTGAETGAGGALLAMTVMALDNPEIKSKLAISLAKAAKTRLGDVAQRLGKAAIPAATRAVAGMAASPSPKNRLEAPTLTP